MAAQQIVKEMTAIRKAKPTIRTNAQVVADARKGVTPLDFEAFAELYDIPKVTLAGVLHLNPRTISIYKTNKQKFNPVTAEHLLKLKALYQKGEAFLGSKEEFKRWLEIPSWTTTEVPKILLNTPGGVDLLSDELDRMAQGYAI